MNIKIFVAIYFVFIATISYATPSPTSISEDVISGNGFGTKSQASPQVFDTFTRSTISTTADIGSWGSTNSLTITGSSRTTGSNTGTLSFSSNQTAGVAGVSGAIAEKWFVQYWFKLDNDWDWGTSTYGNGNQHLSNIKLFRMWNPGSIDENFVIATQGWGNTIVYTTEYVDNPAGGYFGSGYQTSWTKDTWHCLQFEYAESAVDANDGIIRVWFNGQSILNDTDIKTREDYEDLKRPFIIGFYNSWGTDAGSDLPDTFYIDDIYVDTTWQRVEVGNNAVYGSCTHREIQIPQEWTDTEITVTWNQGSFEDREAAYLFVIDADGNVSNGLKGYFVDNVFYISETVIKINGAVELHGGIKL